MDNESLEILQMVREKRVTPEQGAELLAALKSPGAGGQVAGGEKPSFIRVKVDITGEDAEKVAVNLNLPLALADLSLKLAEGAKIQRGDETIVLGDYVKQLSGVDLASIMQLVKEGAEGKLVDVNIDGEDGEKVQVEVIVD
ncbi:MAG: hypothetical protein IMF16_03235 [Proteobacteria bacterium]|nr:hypothetical protein [Pseudomonadota bacterium]